VHKRAGCAFNYPGKEIEMKRLRLLTLILIAVSVLIGSGAYYKRKQDSFIYSAKAHHVIYAVWRVEKDGSKTFQGVRFREVLESGLWTEWSASKQSGQINLRDYTDPNSKTRLAKGSEYYYSVAQFRSFPNLLREETVAGIQCFTLDMSGRKLGESGDPTEMSFCPEYGPTPLKLRTSGGLIEALKVY
jgi:hypothetical protein